MSEIQMILEALQEASHEGTLKRYRKLNEVEPYFGTPMGAISRIAKIYAKRTDLFFPLWETKILEAQYLAIAIAKPNDIAFEQLLNCVDESVSVHVLDKLNTHILAKRKDMMLIKDRLSQDNQVIAQRLAWGLETRVMVGKNASEEYLEKIFQRIKNELVSAPELIQWAMNQTLVEMAVNFPDWRLKCIELAENLGVYQDMVVAKGCTSAYAPEWISALLKNRKIDR